MKPTRKISGNGYENEKKLKKRGRKFEDTWGRRRKAPVLSPRSFNQLWKEKRNVNNL